MHVDLSFLYVIIQVIFLEGILSIDNAAVLGAMVSILPKTVPVPWPGPLTFLAAPTQRILGGQRSAALKVGLLGAYLGRGLMLVMASFVIRNPYLKVLGAAYLIKLAFENLAGNGDGDEGENRAKGLEGKKFWSVVVAVELADLAFSLDNVVAVVALSNNLSIVMFGVFIGIVTMRFAAQLFTLMILKEPILKPAAYIVVFNIGAELLLNEFLGIEFPSALKFMISAGTLILAVAYAHIKPLHVIEPVFNIMSYLIGKVNTALSGIIFPFFYIFKFSFRAIVFILRPVVSFLFPRSQIPPRKDPPSSGHGGGSGKGKQKQ
jgi:tellurite resistance protein TerC